MRVFFDTNVLVSSLVSRGLCHDLLRIVLEEQDLIVSRLVVEELTGVLRDKLGAPPSSLAKALDLPDHAEVRTDPHISADPGDLESSDAAILAAAIEARADVLVTGDVQFLAAAEGSAIPVVSSRRLMSILRRGMTYPEGPDPDSQVSETRANPVREKSFQFALDIIGLYQALQGRKEYVISKQLLRSGTSIGAMVEEASAAESRKDFLHKMSLASKEARETLYWLRLLGASGLARDSEAGDRLRTAEELARMLTSILTAYRTDRVKEGERIWPLP